MANRFPLIFNSGAGQIQELAASDNLDLTSSNLVNAGILFTSSGSDTAPSLQIGSGTTYKPGLYSPGTDQLAISTNGTGRLFISSTGRLGIGNVPSAWSTFTVLQVSNSSIASTGGDLNLMANGYYDGSDYRRIGTTSVARQYFNTDGSIAWFQAGAGAANSTISFSTAMTLDSSGRLGIGNSGPSERLDLGGGVSDTVKIRFSMGGNVGTIGSVGSGVANGLGNLTFFTRNGSTEVAAMTIDGSQRIGIGTGIPGHNLHVVGASPSVLIESTGGTTADFLIGDGTVRYYGIRGVAGGGSVQIRNHSGNTALATFTSTGNVGIGTTTVDTTLHIKGANTSGRGQLYIQSTATNVFPRFVLADSANTPYLDMYGDTSNQEVIRNTGSGGKHVWQISSSEAARIDSSGRLLVGTPTTSTNTNTKLVIQQNNAPRSSGGPEAGLFLTTSNGGYALQAGAYDSGSLATSYTWISSVRSNDAYYDGSALPPLVFLIADQECMRITQQKELLIGTSTITANGGILQLKSGITFPVTQVAATDPNTLDEYEEGTWVPTQGGGVTVVGTFGSVGTYVRIGRTIIYAGYIFSSTSVAFNSNAGNLVGAGLPFQVLDGVGNGIATAGAPVYASLIAYGTGTAINAYGTLSAVSEIFFSGSYIIN